MSLKISPVIAYQRNKCIKLQKHLEELQIYINKMERSLLAFWSGNVPENESVEEIILARYGSLRLEAISKDVSDIEEL